MQKKFNQFQFQLHHKANTIIGQQLSSAHRSKSWTMSSQDQWLRKQIHDYIVINDLKQQTITTAMKYPNNVWSIPVIHTLGNAKKQVPQIYCNKIKQFFNTYPTTKIYGSGGSSKQVRSRTNADMQPGDAQLKVWQWYKPLWLIFHVFHQSPTGKCCDCILQIFPSHIWNQRWTTNHDSDHPQTKHDETLKRSMYNSSKHYVQYTWYI